MPIKTIDNAGLSIYEETDDYYILMDKNRVETTVQNYATGTSDIFYSRMRDIENSQGLMRGYSISWSKEDSSKMLLDINSEQLEKLAQTPSLMPFEEDTRALTLETKAVPTSYMCCIRVDKRTGEIYSSDGYENIKTTDHYTIYHDARYINNNEDLEITWKVKTSNCAISGKQYNLGEPYSFSFYNDTPTSISDTRLIWKNFTNHKMGYNEQSKLFEYSSENIVDVRCYFEANLNNVPFNIGDVTIVRKFQITQTPNIKPFVKSIFPNGKLEFESTVNETTHTFLIKGNGVITFGSGSFSLKGEKIQQLLVYKGLLTEQEKQAELAKDIRLK